VLAEPAFPGGGSSSRPSVDGRVKPDHDEIIEIESKYLPDSHAWEA
jgi:hypothetical protein